MKKLGLLLIIVLILANFTSESKAQNGVAHLAGELYLGDLERIPGLKKSFVFFRAPVFKVETGQQVGLICIFEEPRDQEEDPRVFRYLRQYLADVFSGDKGQVIYPSLGIRGKIRDYRGMWWGTAAKPDDKIREELLDLVEKVKFPD